MEVKIKNITRLIGTGVFLCLIFFYSCREQPGNKKIEETVKDKKDSILQNNTQEKEAQWVADILESNYEQIELAQLGQKKSLNIEVKNIAGIIEIEHTGFMNNLKDYAVKKNINIPTETNEAARMKIKKLSDEMPTDFDKKWCQELINQHKKTIDQLESVAGQVPDGELKSTLRSALPKIRMHLDNLMICNSKMKN